MASSPLEAVYGDGAPPLSGEGLRTRAALKRYLVQWLPSAVDVSPLVRYINYTGSVYTFHEEGLIAARDFFVRKVRNETGGYEPVEHLHFSINEVS